MYSGQKKKLSAPKQVQNFSKMIKRMDFGDYLYMFRFSAWALIVGHVFRGGKLFILITVYRRSVFPFLVK